MEVPWDSVILHQMISAKLSLKDATLEHVDAAILHHLSEDPAVSLWSECGGVTLCTALQKYLSWLLINPVLTEEWGDIRGIHGFFA